MIVVTGATGKLGSLVIEKLLERLPAQQIGASARDPGKAPALSSKGVRVRHGDFEAPDTLSAAFESADQIFLVSSNTASRRGDQHGQHRAAIDAAKAAGAGRIVYTSQISTDPASLFPPGRDHAATEALLREGGLAWTSLRHGFYASSALGAIGDYANTGLIAAPQDGKVSCVTHEDLAEADAAILLEEGRFEGPTPPLTGPEALDFADLVRTASEVLGREIRREITSEEELRSQMRSKNIPDEAIAIATGMYAAMRANEFAAVDPTLAELIGHPPQTMRAVLAAQTGEHKGG